MPPFFYVLPGYFFCLITGIIYFKHLPKSYRLVFYLFLMAMLCEACGYYLAHYLHRWNWWVFNLYMQLEVWFMGCAALYLVAQRTIRIFFLSVIFFNTAVWSAEIMMKTIYQPSNVAMVCYSISLAGMYIVVLFSNSLFSKRSIIQQPIFWLAASAILYFSCIVPYMALSSFLFQRFARLAYKLHTINIVLNVLRYSLIAISFILLGRQTKKDHLSITMLNPEIAQ
jgi:hypothetical protein